MADIELDNILNGEGVGDIINPDFGDLEIPELPEIPEINDIPIEVTPANTELIYYMNINENTYWSSHDEEGNLISQRLYQTDPKDDSRFICYCDIPCYPTGLFLHLKICGPKDGMVSSTGALAFFNLSDDFHIKFFPYTGQLEILDTLNDYDVAARCSIESCWGTCVPKTYCTNYGKVFGYHDFKLQKLEGDLQEKWYHCINDVAAIANFGLFKKSSVVGTFGSRSTTTSVTIWFTQPSITIKSVSVFNINSGNRPVRYVDYIPYDSNAIILRFSSSMGSVDPSSFTFDAEITLEGTIEDLQNIKQFIFMDPNLWAFETRKVSEQTEDELKNYPLYKRKGSGGLEEAIYSINNQSITGTYSFLAPTGSYYRYSLQQDDDTIRFNAFEDGYNSVYPADLFPAKNASTSALSVNDAPTYYSNVRPDVCDAKKISRIGVLGNALKANISYKDNEIRNLPWLRETGQEIFKESAYSIYEPYILLNNSNIKKDSYKGFTVFLDQFHLLVQDAVYRFPRQWRLQTFKIKNEIQSINWNRSVIPNTQTNNSSTQTTYKHPLLWRATNNSIFSVIKINTNSIYSSFFLNPDCSSFLENPVYELRPKTWIYTWNYSGWKGYLKNLSWSTSGTSTDLSFSPLAASDWELHFPGFAVFNKIKGDQTRIDSPLSSQQTTWSYIHQIGTQQINYDGRKQTVTSKRLDPSYCFASDFKADFGNEAWDVWALDGFGMLTLLCGLQCSGYRMNLQQERRETSFSGTSLTYLKNDYTRSILPNCSFTDAYTKNSLLPATTWGDAPLNAIPLIDLVSDKYTSSPGYTNLDEWSTSWGKNNWFFNATSIDTSYQNQGDSFGLDVYLQLFDMNDYPAERVYIYAWPEAQLITETKIYTTSFAIIHRDPVVNWDTGIAVNDNYFNINVITGTSWPQLDDAEIDSSGETYKVTGRLVFYGGGSTDGIAQIKFSYNYYK